MITSSEIVVTTTIWVLTAAGGFFSIRNAIRKKKVKIQDSKTDIAR